MTRRAALIALLLALSGTSGCGKKGEILPPLARAPQPVRDVSLSRVGNRVFLGWTNPSAYVDGNPLKGIPEIEVWVIEEAAAAGAALETPDKRDIEKKGRLMTRVPGRRAAPAPGKEPSNERASAVLEPDPAVLARKSLFFSLRARDEKKRLSEFSDLLSLPPGPLVPPPSGLRASALEKSIDLSWVPPAPPGEAGAPAKFGFNVYRSDGSGVPVRLNSAPVDAAEFRDERFAFGKVYVYFVRSAAAGGYESENSESVKVEPVDRFPPAAPQGLTLIVGEGFIALSWEPATEPDLAGYRVWRRGPGRAPLAVLKELSPAENSFTDTEVENNKRYVYAVTAFDGAGNESAKSGEAAGLARRPRG